MSRVIECQKKLLALASHKGYLTFDDILEAADASLLSLSEIDRLSDNIQSLGVLFYETEPEQSEDDTDACSDYSRTDYGVIFSEITSLSDAVSPLIELVKEILPPQFGEVRSLVEQLQYGNNYARERLILSHLRIALKIALSISKQYSYNIEDAVSASFIGLLEAVERFDPNGFSAFQSYASMWIQQNIHRYCNPVWLYYYCPVHVKEKMYPVLLRHNNDDGTIITEDTFDNELLHTIAKEADLTPKQVEQILRFSYNQRHGRFNLDYVIAAELEQFAEVNTSRFDASIALFSPEDDLFEKVAANSLEDLFEELLAIFSPREQEVVRMRFGLGGYSPRTLEEVGQEFNITRERVRQIENKCIRKLRQPRYATIVKDFFC